MRSSLSLKALALAAAALEGVHSFDMVKLKRIAEMVSPSYSHVFRVCFGWSWGLVSDDYGPTIFFSSDRRLRCLRNLIRST